MKAMDKTVMLDRNKVHRACAERQILDLMDHPFLPTLYASFQVLTLRSLHLANPRPKILKPSFIASEFWHSLDVIKLAFV